MKKQSEQQRGFALLMVVIIVALIAIMAAALLDQVEVDLISVGEHRRTMEAKGNAAGAMGEVLTDRNLDLFLPHPMSGAQSVYMQYDGANYVYDPVSLGTGPAAPVSPYVTNVGTGLESGYMANVGFLRTSHAMESAVGTVVTLVYEIDVNASVTSGRATDEVRAEISRPIVKPDGALWNQFRPRR